MTARIGTAGWAIPAQWRDRFPPEGSALERYSRVLNCVEINSTFYRSHKPATFERWAASVPDDFAFSVKAPKEITHVRRLAGCEEPLRRFLDETANLGNKREIVLVQLPPKLSYSESVAVNFFTMLRSLYAGSIALEPRHPSWFTADVEHWMISAGIIRVAADPARVPEAAVPGGSTAQRYFRLHGSPEMYRSAYSPEYLAALATQIRQTTPTWCIFDNTSAGAAAGDALVLLEQLGAAAIFQQDK